MNNVKSLQITWEDGRISWIKPYRVKISVAGLGDQVNVKWGKSKKLFPGTITGIEEYNCVQKSPEHSGGENHSLEDPRDDVPHFSSWDTAGNDESGAAPNCANDITLCINSTLNDVESTPLVTSGHVHQAEVLNSTSSADQQIPVDRETSPHNTRPRCVTCSGVFRPQYRPITCSSESCPVLVHRQQQCSGLNREEQRSGKEWTCSAHGGDGPVPWSINPTSEAADGPCLVCKRTFRSNISPLVCELCSGGAHATCSGLDRWKVAKLRKSGKWKCQNCSGEPASLIAPEPEDLPKGRCDKCHRAICKDVRRAKCCTCLQLFHRSCTGLTKDSIDPILKANNWACQKCCANGSHPSNLPAHEQPREKHEPRHCGPTGSLRILQWNADGLNPKIAELREFVDSNKIDIAMIQETKLTANKTTPKLYGYSAVRADRPDSEFPGGGLLLYIKHNIAFRKIGHAKNGLVEAQSVSIQQRRGKLG